MRRAFVALSVGLASGLAFGLALPLPADAADTDIFSGGITRAELADVLIAYGMSVKDTTETDADPWLEARTAKGVTFYVNMYECAGKGPARRCELLQFQAQWQLNKTTVIKANDINAYNLKFVFGRAALSEDGHSVVFDYPINLKDGITEGNLKKNVDYWLRVLDDVRATFKVF